MKVAIASDHAGFEYKEKLRRALEKEGHEVVDRGPLSDAPCDYPDYAGVVAKAVAAGECERGVLVCGTGIGMGIAANKTRGVRAAVCWNEETTRLARAHNDANVLCLGGRTVESGIAEKMVRIFLDTPGPAEDRHRKRVDKVLAIEDGKGNDA